MTAITSLYQSDFLLGALPTTAHTEGSAQKGHLLPCFRYIEG